ncbi:MAG: FAD-dependent monooxygenase [Maritimibacter sp.]
MSGITDHLRNVLIVGGGVGGPAAAILLAERGVKVDLVDISENWGAAGTGVTLSALTARALCDLGFAEDLMARGHLHDSLEMYNPTGEQINVMSAKRLYSDDIPAEGGVMRPVLHDMMATRMSALGVTVRTGMTVDALTQSRDAVQVSLSDGSRAEYDLVIGADGLFSNTREMIMPDAPKPSYTGQVCWRAQFRRPEGWDNSRMYFGRLKIGFTPCSPDHMYMYLLENVAEKPWYDNSELLARLKSMLEPFRPALGDLIDGMDENTPIMARPLESILLEDDWFRGRVLLIGDAAHSTTPHLASGAGMAVEDALVLVDELEKADTLKDALSAFVTRRMPRGKLVVGNSLKLGQMEIDGAPAEEIGKLMGASLHAIEAPY